MPAWVLDDPLAVTFRLPRDEPLTMGLDDLPNPALARDLAVGVTRLAHPHGPIARAGTATQYVRTARRMVRELHAEGFIGGAAQLRRTVLVAYWLRGHYGVEHRTRRMLRALEEAAPVLPPETRDLVLGRNFKKPPPNTPLPPYTPGEWSRLLDTCRVLIRQSWRAHQRIVPIAEAGADPAVAGWSEPNIAWLLRRWGPVGRPAVAEHLGTTIRRISILGGLPEVRDALFPAMDVVIAYRLLLGAYTGIVPDGLDGLDLGDIDWAGDDTVLLSYLKGRTGDESLTLSPRASRLLRQWLRHSELLRGHAAPEVRDRFWLAATYQRTAAPPGFSDCMLRKWIAHHEVRGDDGEPLTLHKHRVRTTYHAERATQGWSGHATIDPNHSAQAEGDRYLAVATPAQQAAVNAIITDAQADLLRRAERPTVLTDDDTVELVAQFPEQAAGLVLDETVLRELVGGQRDVFTAACADQLVGLHGPKGKPCPARPWVCLLCPLAVFAPRHLPNLLRLKAFFARQFRQMPREQFAAVFGPYAHRLSAEVLPRFAPAAIEQAGQQVADVDAELPLRPEEATEEAAW
ncbi:MULTISPECIES: hypothetical protein [Prauserella salsuginis group]|uniref:Integrase n=1 Tax=Prauserella salsuginis TaxID=387889 RepID=A0ABW6G2B0_9PSEU|nr:MULTISPECIES: hypothetical protein [Prauserella salsuginis group]MCR3719917.1 hypothetical protein [Prauserella flava]MCR3736540.1 hypothetical protein [Prauserella salsuginis]